MCGVCICVASWCFLSGLSRGGDAYSYIYDSVVLVPTKECMALVGPVVWTL